MLLSLLNHAGTLLRPAEDEHNLKAARDALTALRIGLVAPTTSIAVSAARHRALNIGLADGFALVPARARNAHVASFDGRVRRALPQLGLRLAPRSS